jgi:hypothetical protein
MLGDRAVTVGDVVISQSKLGKKLWRHESRHANQYAILGLALVPVWVYDQIRHNGCGLLEGSAGYESGGYDECI